MFEDQTGNACKDYYRLVRGLHETDYSSSMDAMTEKLHLEDFPYRFSLHMLA